MIRFYHVYKTFEPHAYVLRDINLVVPKGGFAFITGPSGAGKTTLLQLLLEPCPAGLEQGQGCLHEEHRERQSEAGGNSSQGFSRGEAWGGVF
jgi:ABC-type ATPase involved in cell division